jgi:hypothetical protein
LGKKLLVKEVVGYVYQDLVRTFGFLKKSSKFCKEAIKPRRREILLNLDI